jgi:hypothetical protein
LNRGGTTARPALVKVGRKNRRLMVEVFDPGTGTEKMFLCPFQRPAFKHIQVSVRSGNGAPDEAVVTARKGKRAATATFPA